ncbi:MAG: 5-oxoprolinase subunit PxpB [Bacteroidota bacterium]
MIRFHSYNVHTLLVEWEQRIDPLIHASVYGLLQRLQQVDGLLSVVPAYQSLAIRFDPTVWKMEDLQEEVEKCLITPDKASMLDAPKLKVPVCYEPEYALDAERLVSDKKQTWDSLVAAHQSTNYRVYMLGFLPGFPYLGILPEVWETPRLAKPRALVPAGSVAVAGRQTGIYPLASPGGWSIIGRCPVPLFQPKEQGSTFFQPGDEVQFFAVNSSEFKVLLRNPPTRTDCYVGA